MSDDENRFKFLYELIGTEYKEELERGKKLEEKSMRLFNVLNIMFPLLATILLRKDTWDILKELPHLVFCIVVFLVLLIFLCLSSAWFECFSLLKSKPFTKLMLKKDNEFECAVYDGDEGMSHLYSRAYQNYQLAIEINRENFNGLYKSLELSQNWVKRAFSFLCVFLFILFLCYLSKVCI